MTTEKKMLDKPCVGCNMVREGANARFYCGGEFEEDDTTDLGKIVKRKQTYYRVIPSAEIPICDHCVKKYQLIRLIPCAFISLLCLLAFLKTTLIFWHNFGAEGNLVYLPVMAFFLYGCILMLMKVRELRDTEELRDKMAIAAHRPALSAYRFFTQREYQKFRVKEK